MIAICLASHTIEPSYTGLPKHRKKNSYYYMLRPDRHIEDFDDPLVYSVSGIYSTWLDETTGQQSLVVTPIIKTRDLPDRLTIFTQFSSKDGSKHQSTICDMYTNQNLTESPYTVEDRIVFNTVD